MSVVITGAGGQLARELTCSLGRSGHEVGAADAAAIDVRDPDAIHRLIRVWQPRVVIDCALPRNELRELPRAAMQVAEAAKAVGALSIYISCADVFDGGSERPYVESDVPRPTTPFGAAKLDAERGVARSNPRHAIVRSSWLLGLGAPNVVEDVLAGATGDRLELTTLTRGSPTYIPHLAEAIVSLVRQPAYGIFHAVAAGSCTNVQLARTVLRAIRSEVRAVVPGDDPAPSSGELRSLVLESRRPELPTLPDWRLGVSAYLERRLRVQGGVLADGR